MSGQALFFYGTLCHMPLLSLVLDRDATEVSAVPARLEGHVASWVKDQPFPMIATGQGIAEGLLVRDLSEEDIARIDYYEGGFAYDLRPVTVATADGAAKARVYFPHDEKWQTGAAWSLADWATTYADLSLRAACEVMARYGKLPVEAVQQMLPFFRARAWANQLAAKPAPQTVRSKMTIEDLEILAMRDGYAGFFRIEAFDLRHRRFDGSWSGRMSRESFVAYDAALVLPYDPVTDQVLVIEQMRFGPIWRNDPAPWVFEPIAGLVDAGEDPADTARREAVEEAGVALGDLQRMAGVYASPGYTSEFFHCFLGLCDLQGVGQAVGGLASENEDIRRHVLPFDAAMALVESGEINAAPLVMMLLWLGARREALRASA